MPKGKKLSRNKRAYNETLLLVSIVNVKVCTNKKYNELGGVRCENMKRHTNKYRKKIFNMV